MNEFLKSRSICQSLVSSDVLSVFVLLITGKYSNTYSDPMLNAPACFLQRIGELTTLEAQTVRREKTTKSKKKQFLQ